MRETVGLVDGGGGKQRLAEKPVGSAFFSQSGIQIRERSGRIAKEGYLKRTKT